MELAAAALAPRIQARRPKKSFLDTICRAKNDLSVTEIRLWASFGVSRYPIDLFLAMFEQNIGQKPGKYSPAVQIPYRNQSGVGELVGKDPLFVAIVENAVIKILPKKTPFWPKKLQFLYHKQQFSIGNENTQYTKDT